MTSGVVLILACIGLMGLFKFFAHNCKTPDDNGNDYDTINEIPPKYEDVERPPSYSN